MNGILNVYKQKGPTSHDVVNDLRHILDIKKAGHAGTLDPQAEGVLPVCLGKATKLSSQLADSGKTYRTVMLLGTVTDTQDLTGKVISESLVNVTEAEVRDAVSGFVGEYDQIPPMYSARKVQGKKLYELAREGKEVERKPKRVNISSIVIDDISLPEVTMTINCSKGTYIRTLCHDIGQKLGCGACMESLIRTRVGRFELASALTIQQIKELMSRGELQDKIMPVDGMFSEYPSLRAAVEGPGDKFLHNGNPVSGKFLTAAEETSLTDGQVRMYDSKGGFIGVYRYDVARRQYVPVMLFI